MYFLSWLRAGLNGLSKKNPTVTRVLVGCLNNVMNANELPTCLCDVCAMYIDTSVGPIFLRHRTDMRAARRHNLRLKTSHHYRDSS